MSAEEHEPERHAAFDIVIVLILLLAVAFRLYRVDVPLIDAHSWRQVTNADITRHFSEGIMNPFMPRVSWGGLNGAVGMEFSLLHYVTAIIWRKPPAAASSISAARRRLPMPRPSRSGWT